jgi:hypothetical protein
MTFLFARIKVPLSLVLLLAGAGGVAWGDAVMTAVGTSDGTVNGIRGGKLSVTLTSGGEKLVALEEVTAIAVDNWPPFAAAEAVRGDNLQAVKAYRELLAAVNKPELRLVAQWRAIEPLDRAGQWVEAVGAFLDVYGSSPAEGVWKVRPTRVPAAGSKMLGEGAEKVVAAVKAAKGDEARKNLQGWLLEMYTRAGDTAAAQRLAREMSGAGEEPVRALAGRSGGGGGAGGEPAALGEVEAAFRGKDYDGVVKKADAGLATARGDVAVELFAFKAQALEALGKDEEAAGTWLRIAAHYPGSSRVPEAVLRAGKLEKKVGHGESAKALFREVMEKYPQSREAAAAKGE